MESANEGWEDVGGLEVEVVSGSIEVGGHQRDRVEAVLLAVGFAGLNACDFGDGVPFVRGFEGARQKIFFFERLWSESWIDAGGTQEKKFRGVVAISCVDDIGLESQIIVNEIGRVSGIGENAAHLGGGDENIFGFFVGKEGVDGLRVSEV